MKINNIKIREATTLVSDITKIVNYIYQSEEFPGGSLDETVLWTKKRLERGFYIQLAEIDGIIIGHTEWVISDEPDRKYLFLSMINISEDFRRQNIGGTMIADGIEYAKRHNCTEAVTVPDIETNADAFYRKCGFKDGRKHYSLSISTEEYKDYQFEKISLPQVPFSAIKEKRFVFGKDWQCSSRFMWEILNEKPCADKNSLNPVILLDDGTCIQIVTQKGSSSGNVCIWTNNTNTKNIMMSALSFAHLIGLSTLDFDYIEDEESYFDGFKIHNKKYSGEFEQIYYITP